MDNEERTAQIYTGHFWIFCSIWYRVLSKSIFSLWILITIDNRPNYFCSPPIYVPIHAI